MTRMKSRLGGAAMVGTCIATIASTIHGGVAQADQRPLPFVMTVVSNQAEGERVLAGDYEAAIRRIQEHPRRSAAFATPNNLCVAYVKARRLDEAGEACERALEEAGQVSAVSYYEAGRKYDDRAVALTNRGVLRAVVGDEEGARRDFRAAAELDRRFTAAAANLELLEAGPVATAASTAGTR